jgi:DUF4097 and DUF4098 domain-containing protein YvlB
MMRTLKNAWLAAAVLAVAALAGCVTHSAATGSFERTFTVNGPVRLELSNGSGDARVTAGPPGEVRIHAEFRVNPWPWENAQQRLQELESNPPIAQEGNLIRIGGPVLQTGNLSVDYTISVPPDTQLHGTTGSGGIDVKGIAGPANFVTGSGKISAADLAGDAQALAGSGDIHLSNIAGQVQVTVGSGNIDLNAVHGEIRAQAGSGEMQIEQPKDTVIATTGSGSIRVTGASPDLRLRTASGNITIDGNPGASNYWDFHSASGSVTLKVPAASSFRLYARSSSGEIDAAIPIVMEGTAGKHELRARIGDGKARVEIETSSGNIALR